MVRAEEKEEEWEERERRKGGEEESAMEREACTHTVESKRCDECTTKGARGHV